MCGGTRALMWGISSIAFRDETEGVCPVPLHSARWALAHIPRKWSLSRCTWCPLGRVSGCPPCRAEEEMLVRLRFVALNCAESQRSCRARGAHCLQVATAQQVPQCPGDRIHQTWSTSRTPAVLSGWGFRVCWRRWQKINVSSLQFQRQSGVAPELELEQQAGDAAVNQDTTGSSGAIKAECDFVEQPSTEPKTKWLTQQIPGCRREAQLPRSPGSIFHVEM
ncbi:uncharacterized protein LOC121669310 isoform X1 [Corvus kubaryi]|uniref:uncharacterized protein LOC121669310 isoform X1 n=2 Tax=Corvus kubaryi TaxID=68294 RepID=UPI001C03F3C1|nr:uncharacterized protein LOC121669310 isoform X1 [Corvus kubaryi]XP_041894011.1 uncharacterized protein LOC121669310 isoform X1 [Corvus kubaryi]